MPGLTMWVDGANPVARAHPCSARARVNLPCPPARLQCSLSSSQSPSSARSRRKRSAISWSVYGSSPPLPARAASAWSSVTYTAPPAVSAPIARISPKGVPVAYPEVGGPPLADVGVVGQQAAQVRFDPPVRVRLGGHRHGQRQWSGVGLGGVPVVVGERQPRARAVDGPDAEPVHENDQAVTRRGHWSPPSSSSSAASKDRSTGAGARGARASPMPRARATAMIPETSAPVERSFD